MSSAVLRIQVATLSNVPDGQSRIDGVPNQLVTLQSVGTGQTHLIRLFDVCNPLIAGSSTTAPIVPTLTPVGDGRTWTFTPPGGATGFGQSFGIELIVDLGLGTEVRSRRKYAIPTQNQQLVLPLFSEGADREASLNNIGTAQIANSVDNAGNNWRGYHPRLLRFLASFDTYLNRIWMSPNPQSPPVAQPSTTPTHVGTLSFFAGALFSIDADLGDAVDPTQPTVLTLRRQSDAFQLAQFTVTQRKLWIATPINPAVSFTVETPCEVYINSQNAAGQWACKGIRFSARLS